MTKNTDPRNALMAALSAAEQVAAMLPEAPYDLNLHGAPSGGPYTLELHFPGNPEAVASLAGRAGGDAVTREFLPEDPRAYTEMTGLLFGHVVRAFSLAAPKSAPQVVTA